MRRAHQSAEYRLENYAKLFAEGQAEHRAAMKTVDENEGALRRRCDDVDAHVSAMHACEVV